MKKNLNFLLCVVAILFSATITAQSTITGTVIDTDINAPLPGANIVEKGTSNGTSSDFDGKFTLSTIKESGVLVITYVGYTAIAVPFTGSSNLGDIKLNADNSLDEVVIIGSGVIDLAEDRKTPVAVSTITSKEIRERAGNFDLPVLLKSTRVM